MPETLQFFFRLFSFDFKDRKCLLSSIRLRVRFREEPVFLFMGIYDFELVWKTIHEDLPELHSQVLKLIEP